MAVTSRGNGIGVRGGGGGGGGAITINNDTGDSISEAVTTIEWRTEALGFTATVDSEDSSKVIIGVPAVFSGPIAFFGVVDTPARVSESDLGEHDTFVTDGWENTTRETTLDANPTWTSSTGRGFGTDASINIQVSHGGGVLEDQTFTCSSNGVQNLGHITCTVSNVALDGDGSVSIGRVAITTNLEGILGSSNSGSFSVTIVFTEHKWGDNVGITEEFFYDIDNDTPIINGDVLITEDITPANRVFKYISGIGYYTTGNPFDISVDEIDNHNNDTSHPNASLSLGTGAYGITPYTSSPWVDPADWANVSNLDTGQGFAYTESVTINKANYRFVGNADIFSNVKDSFNSSVNVSSIPDAICIDTYGDNSNATTETFNGESFRLQGDYDSAWDSETILLDSQAAVFGGNLVHASDIHTINEAQGFGALGSITDFSDFEPNEQAQPNYSGFGQVTGSFIRRFAAPDNNSKAGLVVNISTNGSTSALLTSGDLRVYIWKEDSINTDSPNIIEPDVFDPNNPADSLVGSIWLHGNNGFNFATFEDGSSQTNGTATCRTGVAGTSITSTFSGNDCIGGILMRVDILRGVTVAEISVTFV